MLVRRAASAAAWAAAICALEGAAVATDGVSPTARARRRRAVPAMRRATHRRAPGTAVHVPTSSAAQPRGARRSTQTAPGGAPL